MNLIEQIKQDEGFRGKPYMCTAGKLTIGYGRNLDSGEISEPEASFMLESDIIVAEEDLESVFLKTGVEINEVRWNALVNMRFQLGGGGFRGFKKAIAAIRSQDWAEAGAQILDSKYARQVPTRAQRVANEIITGVAED